MLVGTVPVAPDRDDSPMDRERTHRRPRRPTGARKDHARALFAGLPRQYDRAGAALSFGQDPRWRRGPGGRRPARRASGSSTSRRAPASSRAALAPPLRRARRRPRSEPGDARSAARGCRTPAPRPHARRGEAEQLPFADGEFDHLTFTYLLRYVDDPAATLRELARVVAPGGRDRLARVRRSGARAVAGAVARSTRASACRRSAARLSPEWAEAGRFLARSIPDFYARHPLAGCPPVARRGHRGRTGAADELRRGRRHLGEACGTSRLTGRRSRRMRSAGTLGSPYRERQ